MRGGRAHLLISSKSWMARWIGLSEDDVKALSGAAAQNELRKAIRSFASDIVLGEPDPPPDSRKLEYHIWVEPCFAFIRAGPSFFLILLPLRTPNNQRCAQRGSAEADVNSARRSRLIAPRAALISSPTPQSRIDLSVLDL